MHLIEIETMSSDIKEYLTLCVDNICRGCADVPANESKQIEDLSSVAELVFHKYNDWFLEAKEEKTTDINLCVDRSVAPYDNKFGLCVNVRRITVNVLYRASGSAGAVSTQSCRIH